MNTGFIVFIKAYNIGLISESHSSYFSYSPSYKKICICQNTTNVETEEKKFSCHSETPGTVLSDRLPGKVVCFPSGVDKPARLTIGWYLDLLLMVFVFDKLKLIGF